MFDKQLTVTIGKMDASGRLDQSEYANDEVTQFLGCMFKNSSAIEFPADNAFGVDLLLAIEPIDFVHCEVGYFEGDADFEDIFDGGFYAFQIHVIPSALFEWIDAEAWNGNYRFYSWINMRQHTKLLDLSENKKINYGFGASCDQMITDVFGIFGRYGWQRPDVMAADAAAGNPPDMATVEHAWSAGAQMTGKYWWRENDILAFAVGQAFPSDEYDRAGGGGSAEGHIEVYYSVKLNECLTVTPDIQVIWNPNGIGRSSEGDNDTIFVYGLRGQFDF